MRFSRADHTNWVLSSFWHFEHAPVLFKRWTPLFDPETEQIGIGPIWTRLPGLPLHFWLEDVFIRIGDAIGTYMDHDKSYQQTGMMAYARILVNLDRRGGLLESITIQWRETTRKQIIDYEGIPYRCRRCHKVGHLYRDCSLIRRECSTDREVEQDLPQDEVPQAQPVQHTEDPGQTLNEGEPRNCSEDVVAAEHTNASPTANAPEHPLSEHKDLDHSGKSSTLHISTSPVTCMSMGSVSHHYNSSGPSYALFISSPHSPHIHSQPSLTCTLPFPSPTAPLSRISLHQSSLSSQYDQSSPRYDLCPRTKGCGRDAIGFNLASVSLTLKNFRGRPSRISKARHTADEEVALGRQQTIFGALRAKDGPIPLPP